MDGLLVAGFYSVLFWVQMALAVFAVFAFADAATRRRDAFVAADKKTKPFWLIILALGALIVAFVPLLSFLPIIGIIATIVYMVDVRPAIRAITGGAARGRGSSSDGPYGPYNGPR